MSKPLSVGTSLVIYAAIGSVPLITFSYIILDTLMLENYANTIAADLKIEGYNCDDKPKPFIIETPVANPKNESLLGAAGTCQKMQGNDGQWYLVARLTTINRAGSNPMIDRTSVKVSYTGMSEISPAVN